MQEKTIYAIAGVVGVLAVVAFLQWSAQRDAKIMVAADKYEQCVKAEYGTTPTAWYIEHGKYPECGK
jgi:predicted negative regulator of RcsB-dependent stress response